jgi:hypothetical protein
MPYVGVPYGIYDHNNGGRQHKREYGRFDKVLLNIQAAMLCKLVVFIRHHRQEYMGQEIQTADKKTSTYKKNKGIIIIHLSYR